MGGHNLKRERERDHLEKLYVGGRIILKLVFINNQQNVPYQVVINISNINTWII
jgi:hypothetical protein